MSKINALKNKIIVPKKEQNDSYNKWVSLAHPQLKEKLSKLSNKYVAASFNEEISLHDGKVSAELGLGTNKLNTYTLEKITRSLQKYAKLKGWKTAAFATSNLDIIGLINSSMSNINNGEISLSSFKDPVMTLSELSFAIQRREIDFGVYFNANSKRASVTILGENGRLLKEVESEEINKILKNEDYNFDFEFDTHQKIQLISDKEKLLFKEIIKRNIEPNIAGDVRDVNKVLINTSSRYVYNKLVDIYAGKQNVRIHFSEKGTRYEDYDITVPSSFREAYFIANKEKINTIINIDGSGSKLSLAIKVDRTWNYLTSDKIYALLINKLHKDKKLVKGDKVLTTIFSSPLIIELAKKFDLETVIHEEGFSSRNQLGVNISGDINYNFSLTTSIIAPDALIPASVIVSYFIEQNEKVDLNKILTSLSSKTYYERIVKQDKDYEGFKEDITYISREGQFADLKVKSIKVIDKNDDRVLLKISVENGYAILRYSFISETLTSIFHISSYKENDAFYSRRNATKGMKSLLAQNYKNEKKVMSKKSLVNTLILFAFTVGILLITFTYLFDWEAIGDAFVSMSGSFDTPYPYVYFLTIILGWFSASFFMWVIMKMLIGKEIMYRHLLIGTLLSGFVRSISPSYLMGPAFLLWYLRRQKYHAPDILAALALQQVVIPLIMMVLNIYFLGVGNAYIYGMDAYTINGISSYVVSAISWVGWGWVSFNVFFYIALGFSKNVHQFIFYWIEKGLFWVKREKQYKSIREELDFNARKMRGSLFFITKSPKKVMIIAAAPVAFAILGQFQSSFAINMVAETPMDNYWQTMTLGTISGNASVFVPIPGKAGLKEYFNQALYAAVVHNNPANFGIEGLTGAEYDAAVYNVSSQIAFLDRLPYYINLVVYGSFFTGFMVKHTFVRK